MKNLEEKKLLVKMARMLGEEVDPALLESIEREEKLASVFFGAPAPEPKAPPIPILKEDLPQPPEPIVEAPADIVPEKEQLVQQIANTLTVPSSKTSPYRDKEIEGIRKQISEMMQKISTMSWGGGGTGIVRIADADDFDRSTFGEGKYLTFSNGWFRLANGSGGGGGNGTLSDWILKTSNYTANSGDRIIADTSAGSFNITLPASPGTGNSVTILDGSDWSLNPITIYRNGSTIENISDNMYSNNKGVVIELVYNGNAGVNTWQVVSTLGPKGDTGASGGNSGNTSYISTAAYTVTANDYYVGINYPGTVNITLPSSTTTGRMIVIKDESGNCSNNPIIVAGTIDNDAGGFNLQIDNGTVHMLYRSGWRII